MVHVIVHLTWIGKDYPSFWKDGKLTMRISFDPVHDWSNEAVRQARMTWQENEAIITKVQLRKSILD